MSKGMLDQTFAYGLRYQNPNTIEIRSVQQRPGNIVDWVDLSIPRQSAGSFTIDTHNCPRWNDECPSVFVVLELLNVNGAQAKYSCRIQTGIILLSSVSNTRAKGEFSGTGDCLTNIGETGEEFRVTNGRFDVNLISGKRG